jgi:ribosomal-protein-alanine N-acetyltransferase
MSAQPQPGWKIRPMQPEHLPQVIEIERRAYPFPWTESIFRDCLKSGYSVWLFENPDGQVVGYGVMSFAVDEAHLLNLCVDPDWQQHGLGRAMLSHLLKIARAGGATLMILEVRKSNRAALKLYQQRGFYRLGERKGYYPAPGGREDALVLGFQIV